MAEKNTTTIMFVAIVILAFVVGVLWQKINVLQIGTKISGTPAPTAQAAAPLAGGKLSADEAKKIPEVGDNDHIRGANDPQIYFIEYSDFECPFCKNFQATLQQAMDEYGEKMAWVYRQFPLIQLHQQAQTESEASECVAKLGGNDAFWKFTDNIYTVTTSNDGLDLTKLPDYAVAAGVDKQKFQDCLDSGETKETVDSQYQGGLGAGVNGTPGSFIINKKGEAWFVPGALPYENLKKLI